MELEYDMMIDDMIYLFYVKSVKNDKKMCCVCVIDETKDGKSWDRYELVCGHQMHTRCLRKWCATKNKLNCPQCGDIKPIMKNRYCSSCKKFGHTFEDKANGEYVCPGYRELLMECPMLRY